MKFGVFTVLFSNKSFEEMLEYVSSKGIEAVELGIGGYPGDVHCSINELLEDEEKLKTYQDKLDNKGIISSALSCHANPLHPQKKIAEEADILFEKTVRLAEKMEVSIVSTFSGCPGDHENAIHQIGR
jgi:sugar phosphate isomerase/epimerase